MRSHGVTIPGGKIQIHARSHIFYDLSYSCTMPADTILRLNNVVIGINPIIMADNANIRLAPYHRADLTSQTSIEMSIYYSHLDAAAFIALIMPIRHVWMNIVS